MVFRVIDHLADRPLEYAFHRQVRPVPANSINLWSANPQSTDTFTETLGETLGDADVRPPPHEASTTPANISDAVVFTFRDSPAVDCVAHDRRVIETPVGTAAAVSTIEP